MGVHQSFVGSLLAGPRLIFFPYVNWSSALFIKWDTATLCGDNLAVDVVLRLLFLASRKGKGCAMQPACCQCAANTTLWYLASSTASLSLPWTSLRRSGRQGIIALGQAVSLFERRWSTLVPVNLRSRKGATLEVEQVLQGLVI